MVPASVTLMDDGATCNIRTTAQGRVPNTSTPCTERPMGHCRLAIAWACFARSRSLGPALPPGGEAGDDPTAGRVRLALRSSPASVPVAATPDAACASRERQPDTRHRQRHATAESRGDDTPARPRPASHRSPDAPTSRHVDLSGPPPRRFAPSHATCGTTRPAGPVSASAQPSQRKTHRNEPRNGERAVRSRDQLPRSRAQILAAAGRAVLPHFGRDRLGPPRQRGVDQRQGRRRVRRRRYAQVEASRRTARVASAPRDADGRLPRRAQAELPRLPFELLGAHAASLRGALRQRVPDDLARRGPWIDGAREQPRAAETPLHLVGHEDVTRLRVDVREPGTVRPLLPVEVERRSGQVGVERRR
eukprot:2929591-Prymnesium_polylepis.1